MRLLLFSVDKFFVSNTSIVDDVKYVLGLQFETLLIYSSVDKNSPTTYFIPHYLR